MPLPVKFRWIPGITDFKAQIQDLEKYSGPNETLATFWNDTTSVWDDLTIPASVGIDMYETEYDITYSGPAITVNNLWAIGKYTGKANATFVITIATGGLTFTWAKNGGAATTVTIGSGGTFLLSDGVSVVLLDGTYMAGSIWTVVAKPACGVYTAYFQNFVPQRGYRYSVQAISGDYIFHSDLCLESDSDNALTLVNKVQDYMRFPRSSNLSASDPYAQKYLYYVNSALTITLPYKQLDTSMSFGGIYTLKAGESETTLRPPNCEGIDKILSLQVETNHDFTYLQKSDFLRLLPTANADKLQYWTVIGRVAGFPAISVYPAPLTDLVITFHVSPIPPALVNIYDKPLISSKKVFLEACRLADLDKQGMLGEYLAEIQLAHDSDYTDDFPDEIPT